MVSLAFQLNPYPSYHLRLSLIGLGLEMKQILKKGEERNNPQEGFTKVDENAYLEDPVGIEIDKFNFLEDEELTEEIAGGDS